MENNMLGYQKFSAVSLPIFDRCTESTIIFDFEHSEGNGYFWTDNGVLRIEKVGFGGPRFRVWAKDLNKWINTLFANKNAVLPSTLGLMSLDFSDGSLKIDAEHCTLVLGRHQTKTFKDKFAACSIWCHAIDNCINAKAEASS